MAASADLYIDITPATPQPTGTRAVDVVIGNRSKTYSRDNFDAFLEAEVFGKMVCRAQTNFMTPIAAGESVRTFRFALASAQKDALQPYTIRASIIFWDHARGGTQQEATMALPAGRATCIALKPAQ